MKAMLATRGEPGRLRAKDIALPVLEEGEVLVRVVAASVSRVDLQLLDDWSGRSEDQAVPGCDCSGIILGTDGRVGGLQAGDRVVTVARPGAIGSGTYAECISVPSAQVVVVPAGLDLLVAAALPLAGLAAYQALYAIMPERGETVLIQGSAGGVGTLAIQLAKRDGARVIADARAAAAPLCRALGADLVVDSRTDDVGPAVRRIAPGGCDAVLDLVDHETQRITAALLARHGRLVTLLSVPDRAAFVDRRVTAWRVDMHPDRKDLEKLLSFAAARILRPAIADVLPLVHAETAHQRLRDGGVQGKLLLRVADTD